MSYFAFVVYILALEAAVVVFAHPPTCGVDSVLCKFDGDCPVGQLCLPSRCGSSICTVVATCAVVRCASDTTVCRSTAPCNTSACTIQPSCVPKTEVNDGIDNECLRQSYTAVVLVQNPSNQSSYSKLTCSRNRSCPSGSGCAGGFCCSGKVPVPLTKPGSCPTNKVSSACSSKSKSCINDYSCPGRQKCCSRCRKVCADPVKCGSVECGSGEVCVVRTPPCEDGMLCILAEVPICVPRQCEFCNNDEYCKSTTRGGYTCSKRDECDGCPSGKICKYFPKQCATTPCPQYECVLNDKCDGCPSGKICKYFPKQCVTTPCPQYECVLNDKCDGCPSGKICKYFRKQCFTTPCPQYECVLKE